jgi:hypothetical protein
VGGGCRVGRRRNDPKEVENSTIAIRGGLAASPEELPIWVPLTVVTWVAALLLLKAANHREVGEHQV